MKVEMNASLNKFGLVLVGLLLFVVSQVQAQQQMQYTQFMFNPLYINPAYAGFSGDRLNATVMSKWQWAGFEGAPFTGTVALDSKLENKPVGLGLIVNSDQVTISRMSYLQAHYAYQINMRNSTLSMGVSGTLSNYGANFNDLYLNDADATLSGSMSDWAPNFGVGVYYSIANINVGFSVPFIVADQFKTNNIEFYQQSRHYYVTAGYVYELSPTVKLEPNVLMKMVNGSPMSMDVNVLARVYDRFAVGLGYRSSESVDLLLQYATQNGLKVGYSFDYMASKTVSAVSYDSHELLVSYTIPRKKDKQPKDSDEDGVADEIDHCPDTPGTDQFGCPVQDTDLDGIPDTEDGCPDLAGSAEMGGCPDSDGDGISDQEDQCPDIAGVESLHGCPVPDSDGDGIPDSEDECPNLAGSSATGGCPDTDGDGVKDSEDECPKTAGTNGSGCPEVSEATKAILDEALKGVQFEPSKDQLKSSSFAVLDNLVTELKDNPTFSLQISGYSDSSGDDQRNLDLSKRRANTVKKYLIQKGIDETRLTADGYGEADPVASNDTPEGRAKNRRVEFEIIYE